MPLKSLLLTTAIVSIAGAAHAENALPLAQPAPIILAQASADENADAAEVDPERLRRRLENAREALQAAEASGKGVKRAQRRVERLEARLNEIAAGEAKPPAPAAESAAPAAEAAAPAAEATPPAAEAAAPAAETAPPAAEAAAPSDTPAQPQAAEAPPRGQTAAPKAAAGSAEKETRRERRARRKKDDAPAAESAPAAPAPASDTASTTAGGTAPPKADATAPAKVEIVVKSEDRVVERTADDRIIIRHDDRRRFGRNAEVTRRAGRNGREITTVRRPNGAEVVTIRDRNGEIIRRVRTTRNGREVVLIDNRDERRAERQDRRRKRNYELELGPLRVTIPRENYVVESRRASRDQIREALVAPPVERVERAYDLDEVRYNKRLRDKIRRVDVDTVTFEFGSAEIPRDQVREMNGLGEAIANVLRDDPDQVFLIEGHTDAVGTDLQNLELSDRRAESVAIVLSEYFDIPPENMITQGYGEEFLKVPTLDAERANRRVAVRPISRLLRGG